MTITTKTIIECLQSAYQDLEPYSQKYQIDFNRYLFTLKIIIEHFDNKKIKILDIGTGIAIIPLALKKLGFTSIGLDTYIFPENNNEMFGIKEIDNLKLIWNKNDLHIINQNIYNFNDEKYNNYFDLVISEATIEHLIDPKEFLLRCSSLIKQQGILIISTPNIATLLKRLRFLIGLSPSWPIENFFNSGKNFTGHWREYTIDELRYMAEITNFRIIKSLNINLLNQPKKILRKKWRKKIRIIIFLLSNLIPNSGDMNYIVAQKK